MTGLELSTLEYVVFDFETTGTYPDEGDEIIEVGAFSVPGSGPLSPVPALRESGRVFETLVNPERPIPEGATEVHGIKDSDLKKAPLIRAVMPSFLKFLGKRVLVAQNAKFDMAFMAKNIARLNLSPLDNIVIDTLLLSKQLFPYEQKHNLDAIANRLQIPTSEGRHRSVEDCYLTAQVLFRFISLLNEQGKGTLKDITGAILRFPERTARVPAGSMSLF